MKIDVKKLKELLYNPTALIVFYWAVVLIACLLLERFSAVYTTIIVIALLAYIPYKMRVDMIVQKENYKMANAKDVLKAEIKPTIKVFLIFAGALMILQVLFLPKLSNISISIKNNFAQAKQEKVLHIKNLDIYINEARGKSYVYYKMNGSSGTEFVDEDNLILADNSEMPLRYGKFYDLGDYEVAFATYKNSIFTEGLFKVTKGDNKYLIKAYIPQENALNLLKECGFKKALDFTFTDDSVQEIYINQTSKEIALLSNNIIITSEYVETPYDKGDYFTYRYDIYRNQLNDPTLVNDDISITMINTYPEVSSDITRVTFYVEGTEDLNYSEIVEIIFDSVSYVFRTGTIDIGNLKSITRAA